MGLVFHRMSDGPANINHVYILAHELPKFSTLWNKIDKYRILWKFTKCILCPHG